MNATTITRRMRPLLGTFVEIGVQHESDEKTVQRAIDAAFERVLSIHHQMSLFDERSALSQLNLAAGRWVALPRDTLRVLKLARALTRLSAQRFNCTVGGELVQRGALPRFRDDEFLPVGCADDIKIDGTRARLLRPVYITLDGIAKGYAVDAASAQLKHHQLPHFWINAGGDLRVSGAIELPVWQRHTNGESRAIGRLRGASLASSHVSETRDDDFPALFVGERASRANETVSVIARFAWRADALTKVALATPLAQRANAVAQWRAFLVDENAVCAA